MSDHVPANAAWARLAADPAARRRWVDATRIARLLTPAARVHSGFASAVVVVLTAEGRVRADVVLALGPPPVDGILRRHPQLVVVLMAPPPGVGSARPAPPPRAVRPDAPVAPTPPSPPTPPAAQPRGTHRWLVGDGAVTVLRGGTRQVVRGRVLLPPPPGFPSLRVPAAAVVGRVGRPRSP